MSYNLYNIHNFTHPEGQGIMEWAHAVLKVSITKINKGELYTPSPHNFILKFLTLEAKGCSTATSLWPHTTKHAYAQVKWKNPITGIWHGPDLLLMWGRVTGKICQCWSEDWCWWWPCWVAWQWWQGNCIQRMFLTHLCYILLNGQDQK